VLAPSGPLPLSSLKESAVTAKLLEGEQLGAKCAAAAGKYAAAVGDKYTNTICTADLVQVLHEMKRQGHAGVAAAWREAGLTWAEFLPEAAEVTYPALSNVYCIFHPGFLNITQYCVQPIGLDVKVWGPVEDRDGMLQRVDALKTAIKAT
jgi:hypothetical protein